MPCIGIIPESGGRGGCKKRVFYDATSFFSLIACSKRRLMVGGGGVERTRGNFTTRARKLVEKGTRFCS